MNLGPHWPAWLAGGMVAIMLLVRMWRSLAWRRKNQPRYFIFRSLSDAKLEAGGDNPWRGTLETNLPIDAIEGEELRAAVERYRSRYPWPPADGDRFHMVHGDLWKV